MNGALFLWALLAVVLLSAAARGGDGADPLAFIFVPLLYGTVGGAVAFVVGAALGLVFALVDRVLFALADTLIRVRRPTATRTSEANDA